MSHGMNLFGYHCWANEKVLDHLKTLPEAVLFQEVKSVFPSLSDLLYHMYQVDYIWRHVIAGCDVAALLDASFVHDDQRPDTLTQLEEKFKLNNRELEAFLNNQEDLQAETTIHHPQLGTLHTTYLELLHHVVNHGTYHRGNVTAMLRQLGFKGVSTDYIFYLYDRRD
ncbi:DinB family protein [Thalassobacillus sp. CUG 92003]|uniref:DinB family protein n=1 Tax=Thalassobacillus sp. CUG 92003 TaxID=2736641 RepID=UPI0015E77F19|nr:DinB family protein [Thalassobacillus sp. CUG 92003]